MTTNEVARVIDAARAVAIPLDREVIHILPQEFVVDDQGGIREPVGMAGVRLEAKVHNNRRCVRCSKYNQMRSQEWIDG